MPAKSEKQKKIRGAAKGAKKEIKKSLHKENFGNAVNDILTELFKFKK